MGHRGSVVAIDRTARLRQENLLKKVASDRGLPLTRFVPPVTVEILARGLSDAVAVVDQPGGHPLRISVQCVLMGELLASAFCQDENEAGGIRAARVRRLRHVQRHARKRPPELASKIRISAPDDDGERRNFTNDLDDDAVDAKHGVLRFESPITAIGTPASPAGESQRQSRLSSAASDRGAAAAAALTDASTPAKSKSRSNGPDSKRAGRLDRASASRRASA